MPLGDGRHTPRRFAFLVDEDSEPYLLEIHVVFVDGRPTCENLQVRQKPGGPPVTSEGLRRVPLAGYVRACAGMHAQRITSEPDGQQVSHGTWGSANQADRAASAVAPVRKRRQITDGFLAEVAAVYTGADDSPVRAVERAFGPGVPRPTAARWVLEARRRGYLPPVDQTATTPSPSQGAPAKESR